MIRVSKLECRYCQMCRRGNGVTRTMRDGDFLIGHFLQSTSGYIFHAAFMNYCRIYGADEVDLMPEDSIYGAAMPYDLDA